MIEQSEHTEIKCKMISANCNTLLNGADYSNTHACLAYTSSNLIHVYDPSGVKTHFTLKSSSDRVNVVRWIDSTKNRNDLIEFLSCSSDGTINHWMNQGKEKNPFDHKSWKLEKTYPSSQPKEPVNCLNTLYISSFEKYFASFSAGGNLDLFYYDVDLNEYKMFHSIPFKKKLQDAVCLTVLNDSYLLLLTGGYDSLIHIYTVMRIKEIYNHILEKKEFSPVSHKLSMQGHVNSIRDISAICPELDMTDTLCFASSSQDTYIRLWHINQLNSSELKSIAETLNQKGSLSIFDEYKSKTSYVIKTEKEEYYNIILDSILSGHEDSVSSVKWGYLNNEAVLISSSFDFTVGIWKYDTIHNIWNKDITLGEMVGNKHAFFYATFIHNCNSILAYTYNGSFYLWNYSAKDKQYKSVPVVHGHFGHVSDLDWDQTKSFIITTSKDQTTRIFAPWKANDTWHEINRPQIHGYDIHTICTLAKSDERLICKIVSGADEKIVRIFNSPFNIVKYLENLSQVKINFHPEKENDYYEKYYANIEGSKQALGLMTKQVRVDMKEGEEEENFDFSHFNPDEVLTNKVADSFSLKYDYSLPPDEDYLNNNTLWPEYSKLYGHGYEIISVAASKDGKIIASGGKAQSEKNAKLFLWNSSNNQLICKLEGHSSTISQIEFSLDDQIIVTVSKDRSVCIYSKTEDEKMPYLLVQKEKETHERIIWGCSISMDNELLITGSRDKFVKIWKKQENGEKLFNHIISKEFEESVTSVNFVPIIIKNGYLSIIGFENGNIELYFANLHERKLIKISHVHPYLTHGLTVTRIKSIVDQDIVRFATCSEDYSVRIFEVSINDLENNIKI